MTQPAPSSLRLEYESANTQRRDKLWQLALTTTKVHLALLALALVLGAPSIRKSVHEVQWHNLTGPERVVVWMGYVGLLHAMSALTALVALIVLHRIVTHRSAWPLLFVYIVPQLALLATYETAVLLAGRATITVGQTPGSVRLFIVNSVYLRLAYYAMLSAPLLLITYNLIDHLANRRTAPQADAKSAG